MPTQRAMYLGTEEGVLILAERGGRWEPQRTILEGRDVQALLVPTADGPMYAGLRDSVYVSHDGGTSWDRGFEGNVHAVEVDPCDPQTVYVGTEPVGLYRSRDAGETWEEIESLRRQPESVRERWWSPQYPHEAHVRGLYIDHRDVKRMYVALEHGGVMRTDDGGDTWQVLIDGFENVDIHVVAGHPVHRNVVFAATARGLYRSEDLGRGWVRAQGGLACDHTECFAVASGAHTTLFLAAGRGTPPSWARATGAESSVFRSDDDGVSWQRLDGGLPASTRSAFRGLVVDPLDPARVYLGAVDPDPRVWCSIDRGDTWSTVYESPGPLRLLCVDGGACS